MPPPPLSGARLSDSPAIQFNPPHPRLQSGYQIVPLPLYSGSLAPDAPCQDGRVAGDQAKARGTGVGHRKDTEPIAITIKNWNWDTPVSPDGKGHGIEYLTFWYVGQIADDAVSVSKVNPCI